MRDLVKHVVEFSTDQHGSRCVLDGVGWFVGAWGGGGVVVAWVEVVVAWMGLGGLVLGRDFGLGRLGGE